MKLLPKSKPFASRTRPLVALAGDADHHDFHTALELVRAAADCLLIRDIRRPVELDGAIRTPELIVFAQSRPGTISAAEIGRLQRCMPLAGAVGLLGSWCEGELRTGRPWPGVKRLYWYEFPAWWSRQLALRAADYCPGWARPGERELSNLETARLPTPVLQSHGLVVINVPWRETAEAIADVLQPAGYASVWQSSHRTTPVVRGAVAGIWEGGQLDEREFDDLARFCSQMARHAAPVVALMDFPRRDRCEQARALGAALVMGKPWLNSDLLDALQIIQCVANSVRAA